jgi:protein SCO1/2
MSWRRSGLILAALMLSWPGVVLPATEEAPVVGILPRYLLMAPGGRAVMDSDFRGRFQLIAFGYTYCPDVCPTTLVEMAGILKALGEDAARVQAIFISVDPERDKPENLKTYTEFFDPRILGLTGSPELVRRIADHFKVRYEKIREPGSEHYAVDHSAGMFLLGPDGGFLVKFAYGAPVESIVSRLREYMTASAR